MIHEEIKNGCATPDDVPTFFVNPYKTLSLLLCYHQSL